MPAPTAGSPPTAATPTTAAVTSRLQRRQRDVGRRPGHADHRHQATPTVALGQSITDTATVTGPAGAPGAHRHRHLHRLRPDDATCAGPPIFTSANRPWAAARPPTATSDPFTPTAAGTYRWIATYSGDANYPPVHQRLQRRQRDVASSARRRPPSSPGHARRSPSAAPSPTPPRVTGAPAGPAPPAPSPSPSSAPTTPPAPARPSSPAPTGPWPAARRPPPRSARSRPPRRHLPLDRHLQRRRQLPAGHQRCNDPNETSVVSPAAPTIVTTGHADGHRRQPDHRHRHRHRRPARRPAPTGTVTFTLFGPNDATCAGPPIFTSATRPLAGGPPRHRHLGPFTPTAPGTYRWIAAYSGDANYPPVTSRLQRPQRDVGRRPGHGHHRHPGHARRSPRQPDHRHRHGHRRPPRRRPDRHGHLHPLRPNDATCAGAAVFTSAPSRSAAVRRPRPRPRPSRRRARHLPLDRGLQR